MLKRFIAWVRGAQPEPIEPGNVYALRDGSPWPVIGGTVRVLAVAQGWVRFRVGGGSLFNDERMKESDFRRFYGRVQ